MRKISPNAQRILDHLVTMLPQVIPGNPKTHITYGDLHSQLRLPGTAQDLEFQGMSELATAIFEARLPGITGLIILKDYQLPGKGYFKLYGRKNLDTPWWESEIRRVVAFDWSPYSKMAKPKGLSTPPAVLTPAPNAVVSEDDAENGSSPSAGCPGPSLPPAHSDLGTLDLSAFRLLWSNGWSDFIPARWLVEPGVWADREHITAAPDERRYSTHCAGRVEGQLALLDYGAGHDAVNNRHHHIGMLSIAFDWVEDGTCHITQALWKEAGGADFQDAPISIELHLDPFNQLTDYEPDTFEDARLYSMRLVAMRRGQAAFRQALINAWGGRCAVTGCEILDVLEAAHIVPHAILGEAGHEVCNGLLLRADIHTLFDLNRIRIMPDYGIETDDDIRSILRIPARLRDDFIPSELDLRPSKKALTWREAYYEQHNKQRKSRLNS